MIKPISLMRNITNLLLLSLVTILLLVAFSIQNYKHSKELLYDYLTKKAVSVSLLYESKARKDIGSHFPDPPKEITEDKSIYSLVVLDRNRAILYSQGPKVVDNKSIEKVLETQQLLSERKTINGEELWLVCMPFHLGDLNEGYLANAEEHQPKFKILAITIPLSVGNNIALPAKIQVLLSLSLFILFSVISYWQWKNIRSHFEMQKLMQEKESMAAIGMAASRLAHEIRNPLAGIKGLAQLLEEDAVSDTTKLYTDSIIKESDRLNKIVSQLLEYVKPQKATFKRLNIVPIIQEVINCYTNEIKSKHLEVKINISEHSVLYCDHELILRLFHNLTVNALQASIPSGLIEFSLEKKLHGVNLYVFNEGDGIKAENKEKIFQPFFSTKAKGTGLGLSISRQIMHVHQGEIILRETENGTCFQLYFPQEVS